MNDLKERERWTMKRCCNNCKHQRVEGSFDIFGSGYYWCFHTKKRLSCAQDYDHKCKAFIARRTPEENKEYVLAFRKMMGQPSRKELGSMKQEQCKRKTDKV